MRVWKSVKKRIFAEIKERKVVCNVEDAGYGGGVRGVEELIRVVIVKTVIIAVISKELIGVVMVKELIIVVIVKETCWGGDS